MNEITKKIFVKKKRFLFHYQLITKGQETK
jgi:hypothetical protein